MTHPISKHPITTAATLLHSKCNNANVILKKGWNPAGQSSVSSKEIILIKTKDWLSLWHRDKFLKRKSSQKIRKKKQLRQSKCMIRSDLKDNDKLDGLNSSGGAFQLSGKGPFRLAR